jgi:hypothetical protein
MAYAIASLSLSTEELERLTEVQVFSLSSALICASAIHAVRCSSSWFIPGCQESGSSAELDFIPERTTEMQLRNRRESRKEKRLS